MITPSSCFKTRLVSLKTLRLSQSPPLHRRQFRWSSPYKTACATLLARSSFTNRHRGTGSCLCPVPHCKNSTYHITTSSHPTTLSGRAALYPAWLSQVARDSEDLDPPPPPLTRTGAVLKVPTPNETTFSTGPSLRIWKFFSPGAKETRRVTGSRGDLSRS
jgi:hypothetical protein